MLIWLLWLKENSSHHEGMTVNHTALNTPPTDGSVFDKLRGHDENDEDND